MHTFQVTINNHDFINHGRGIELKIERQMFDKGKPGRIILFFLLSVIILVIGIVVIMLTFGTSLGRVLLIIVGVVLILAGSIIMYKAIRDLIRAIRS